MTRRRLFQLLIAAPLLAAAMPWKRKRVYWVTCRALEDRLVCTNVPADFSEFSVSDSPRRWSSDREIRDMTMSGLKRPAFLLRSLTPLGEVDFDNTDDPQLDLFAAECEGLCGV